MTISRGTQQQQHDSNQGDTSRLSSPNCAGHEHQKTKNSAHHENQNPRVLACITSSTSNQAFLDYVFFFKLVFVPNFHLLPIFIQQYPALNRSLRLRLQGVRGRSILTSSLLASHFPLGFGPQESYPNRNNKIGGKKAQLIAVIKKRHVFP